MKHLSPIAAVVSIILLVAPPSLGEDEDRSFLWRVVKDGRTVYLLGSIHFLKADAYPLSAAIEAAYRGSGTVVFETDIEQMTQAATGLMSAASLDDGQTLEDVVPDDLYRRTVKRVEATGMSPAMVDRMRPWMVALTLTTMELMRAGYAGSHGIDAHFSARAVDDGKQRRALETIEEQVALFTGLSPEQSRDFLSYTLDDLDAVIPVVDAIVETWRRGDVDGLEAQLGESFDEHQELYDRFLTDRNLRWLPQIEALFEEGGDALVVVGALHLVGDEGLVELLGAQGYEVEQL